MQNTSGGYFWGIKKFNSKLKFITYKSYFQTVCKEKNLGILNSSNLLCLIKYGVNPLNASIAPTQKPVNWFAVQINWLVSIWGQHWHLMD